MRTPGRTLSIVAIAMFATLRKGCAAFGSLPARHKLPMLRSQQPHHVQSRVRLHVSASLPQDQESLFSVRDVERELKGALDFARDMDKRYGLCTKPSQEAWSHVDEVYRMMQDLRVDGASSEQQRHASRRTVERRREPSTSGVSIEGDVKGVRYFF
ncbi:hypothetical protein ACHAXT_000835 [Thalassiosira profunda]